MRGMTVSAKQVGEAGRDRLVITVSNAPVTGYTCFIPAYYLLSRPKQSVYMYWSQYVLKDLYLLYLLRERLVRAIRAFLHYAFLCISRDQVLRDSPRGGGAVPARSQLSPKQVEIV
jgi:hypothetical protein